MSGEIHPDPGRAGPARRRAVAGTVLAATGLLSGCSVVAAPRPPTATVPSLAPTGAVGYVVCPAAVTPVELRTATAEPAIRLPVTGSSVLGDAAVTTTPNGRWAYVVTTDGTRPAPATTTTTGPATSRSTTTTTSRSTSRSTSTTSTTAPGVAARVPVDVVVPVDLVTQQARPPIVLPVSGPTHGVALMANGRTLLVAVGTDVLPVDVVTHDVGRPLDLGPGRTIFGLALDPRSPTLYALVDGGVVPVDTATATAGAFLPTGLSVSSVYSPHGIVVTPDGRTVYVVGQGGGEYGGRLLALDAATGATGPEVSFDRFGIADPAAVAVTPDGSTVLVADAANNWIDTVETSSVTTAVQPVSLPSAVGGSTDTGTDHPTDLVVGPAADGAFVVDSFGAVLPYSWSTRRFGHPVAVCSGASSMVVAPAP